MSVKQVDIDIPVIDLQSDNIPQQIKDACETYGFFYVLNHNVTSMESCFSEASSFFSLSNDFKRQCLCNQGNLGYTSFQDETLAPSIQTCGDTKEGYYIGREPDHDEDPIYTNVWPSYHEQLTHWKNIMLQYHKECSALGFQLVQYIAQALNLSSDYFDEYFQRPTALLRLIKYGKMLSDPSKGVYGAGEHSDYGMLTLLATNEVSGLEVYLNNQWIPIPPKQDCFIVNLGDCLEIMTNSKFKSTLHRVIINSIETERYSLAFFYEPNRQAIIKPLLDFYNDITTIHDTDNNTAIKSNENTDVKEMKAVSITATRRRPFDPITYGDYLSQKYENTHIDYKNHNK